MTAEEQTPRRNPRAQVPTGNGGDRTSASAHGARSARTTARTAPPGTYFPHDHARSRAYRWNEDGIAGICDRHQSICFAPRAVERAGSDPEGAPLRPDRQRRQSRRGRQGVLLLSRQHADALVHEVPVQVSAARVSLRCSSSKRTGAASRHEPEFELADTGVFDDNRYFDVFVEYAKAAADDILIRITVVNRGDVERAAPPAAHHLVPQHVVVEARNARARACSESMARAAAVALESRTTTDGSVHAALSRARRNCSSPRTRRTASGSSASTTRHPS